MQFFYQLWIKSKNRKVFFTCGRYQKNNNKNCYYQLEINPKLINETNYFAHRILS